MDEMDEMDERIKNTALIVVTFLAFAAVSLLVVACVTGYFDAPKTTVLTVRGHPIATRVSQKRPDMTYAPGLGSCNLEDAGRFPLGKMVVDGVPVTMGEMEPDGSAYGFYIPPHGKPSDPSSCEAGFVRMTPDVTAKAFDRLEARR